MASGQNFLNATQIKGTATNEEENQAYIELYSATNVPIFSAHYLELEIGG